jgi:hypothetical protein
MMICLLGVLLLQVRVELPEHRAGYTIQSPEGMDAKRSWPSVLDLGTALSFPGHVVLRPDRREGGLEEAYLRACVHDAKARHRLDPQRVTLAAAESQAPEALALAESARDVFGAVVLRRPARLSPVKRAPACLILLDRKHPDRGGIPVAALLMKKAGVDVEVTPDEGGVPEGWLDRHPRTRPAFEAMDDYAAQGRYLDATLAAMDVLDRPETERFGRSRLTSYEGAGIMSLAKVELAVADRRYKDAYLRCKSAAREFSWLPVGEKIRKRLAELAAHPRVKEALGEQD